MRVFISTTILLAATAWPPAAAAPPVFQAAGQAPVAASQTQWGQSPLGMDRLKSWLGLGSQPAMVGQQPMRSVAGGRAIAPQASPQFAPQAPQPTTMQRFRQAVVHNPLTSALTPGNEPATQPEDSFSLNSSKGAPNPEMLVSLAGVAEQAGDIASARGFLNKALEADPNNISTLRLYGRLEDRQGRLDLAERLYTQAVNTNPQHAGALNDLALCYARQSKLPASVDALEKAVVMRPDKVLYRNNLAKVLVETGNKQRAVEHLAAVHGPAVAQFNVGQLLVASGRLAEALPHFRQAVAIDPSFELAQMMINRHNPANISPDAPQVATRPNLPTLNTPEPRAEAPAKPQAAATPQVESHPRLPSMTRPAAPEIPRLLPPVTN